MNEDRIGEINNELEGSESTSLLGKKNYVPYAKYILFYNIAIWSLSSLQKKNETFISNLFQQ